MYPIGDCAIIEQGRIHLVQSCNQVIQPADVQEGLLLAGERSIRQILSSGGRTYGNPGDYRGYSFQLREVSTLAIPPVDDVCRDTDP